MGRILHILGQTSNCYRLKQLKIVKNSGYNFRVFVEFPLGLINPYVGFACCCFGNSVFEANELYC